jgi:ribosomal protein L13
MRKLILATLAVAASVTGASAADAQYYRGGPAYAGGNICQREASRAWNRREADRIYRHCVKEMRRAERDRWRHERRYEGYHRGW